ncbi:HD-GYP domain-containing protein [Alkalihalobacterium elongatum]|uniref:HD-GYP domain-containing protein n=1 Tax=Alkalihalobacterium elongatum TaxID=2675466 RepID=UPI001C1F9857|nr:HD-GYP domain-containing protein [Alkalihalobacterium elongatum]
MKVRSNQLQEGCIVANDLFLHSNQPFIKKSTILTTSLIEIIDIFLIDVVDVENKLVTGERFTPREIIEEDRKPNFSKEENSFIDMYLAAVQAYQKFFQGWQSGLPVNITEIRNLYIPLLEKAMDSQYEIIKLHHYSTKESYVFHHSIFVGVFSAIIARGLGFSKAEWIQVGLAGLMSDAGMSKLPSQILMKNGPLLHEEYEEVKRHPIHSFKMLKGQIGVTDAVLLAILQHHEREDGSGYPMGVTPEKIYAFSQIVAVADVYHAMVSEKHYRTKQSPFKVIEELTQEQYGKFQPSIVQALGKELLRYTNGMLVRLNSGDIGEIIFVNEQQLTRPIVKLTSTEDIINLGTEPAIFIVDTLN